MNRTLRHQCQPSLLLTQSPQWSRPRPPLLAYAAADRFGLNSILIMHTQAVCVSPPARFESLSERSEAPVDAVKRAVPVNHTPDAKRARSDAQADGIHSHSKTHIHTLTFDVHSC